MYTGMDTIEWLYKEQLKVDAEWSERTPRGFRWWADQQAQTIEIIGEETGPHGEHGYLIRIKTELLRSLTLNSRALEVINAALMAFASMAGPVYDEQTRTLSLCSQVWIHDEIAYWMQLFLSVAAVLQIGEARIMGPFLVEQLHAEMSLSGPTGRGLRPKPDEMAEIIATLIGPMGRKPSRWTEDEFQDAVDRYMNEPPALLATLGGPGCAVEFPWGTRSSLCQLEADTPHPRYGNGLFLLQSFPYTAESEEEGLRLALSLNTTELSEKPFGYGFGSYVYRHDTLHFTAFYPNVIHKKGFLRNLYYSCSNRARELSIRLGGGDWTDESFSFEHTGVGQLMNLRATKQ